MEQKMLDYLESLGATTPVIEGVEAALQTYAELGAEWKDAILCETVDDAGQRVWGSLWLFAPDRVCEARDVATSLNCDVAIVTGYHYARFELKDFDWKAATHESRMFAAFTLRTGISGELRASGKNCLTLASIVKAYVVPGLAQQ